jgi:hypothetical protein
LLLSLQNMQINVFLKLEGEIDMENRDNVKEKENSKETLDIANELLQEMKLAAQIIRRTGNDCPIPAYVVQPPAQVTFPTNCCGQFNGGGWNNGCGQCGNC